MNTRRMLGMTLFRLALALACSCPLAEPLWAQEENGVPADPNAAILTNRATQFLEALSQSGVSPGEALRDLVAEGPLSGQKENVDKLLQQMMALPDRYGEPKGFEQLAIAWIGAERDLALVRYLFKFERHPVVWYFTFYRDFRKPTVGDRKDWILIGVRFDSDLEAIAPR